jgi:hypothetical protein
MNGGVKMIEFQYFDGCPNAAETLENLKGLMAQGLIKESLYITEIKGIEEAEGVKFQGSPTILLDGKDIYTGKEPKGYNYTCRIYTFDGEQTGVLSAERIIELYQNQEH